MAVEFSGKWLGVAQLNSAFERMVSSADEVARAIVTESVAVVERAAKGNFEGAHRKGEPHVGGDKPNIVSGDLRRSITPDPVTREGLNSYSVRIGPRMVYGRRVELGYAGGGRGRGRQKTGSFPYFQPAVRDSMNEIQEIHRRSWNKFFSSAI